MSRKVYAPINSSKKELWLSCKALFGALVLFLFLAFVAGAIYILQLPEWQIRKLEISGLEVLEEEEIRAVIFGEISVNYAPFILKSSFFLVNGEKIGRALAQKLPRIEMVTVDKSFPDKLSVRIKERELWGIFCSVQNCAYIDKNGVLYEEAPSSQGSLILKITSDVESVSVPSKALDDLTVEKMEFLSSGLKEKLNLNVIGYQLFSKIPGEIRVTVSDGFKIYFNRDDDLENAFVVIKTVLEEEIKEKRSRLDYIDARFGNKV